MALPKTTIPSPRRALPGRQARNDHARDPWEAALEGLKPTFAAKEEGIHLVQGDCLDVLDRLIPLFPQGIFDVVFADPPYFLSNDGITCQGGKMVKVNKGSWDKSRGVTANHRFNHDWLSRCQKLLKPDGTIWVSGTHHVILSVGFAMQELGMKILNDITWEKPNPPPNLSCRYFTHSTETLLWAAKSAKSKHKFNYQRMKELADGRQMKTVWKLQAPARGEKSFGRHPTQKPEALLLRCLEAASDAGALVLDPFTGSGTTPVAAAKLGRRCLGIEADPKYLTLAAARAKDALASLNPR